MFGHTLALDLINIKCSQNCSQISMKRMTQLDDEENMTFNNGRSQSVMKDRFKLTDKKKTSSPIWLITIGGILVYTISVYYLIDLITITIENQKIDELQDVISKVKQEKQALSIRIEEMQKELSTHEHQRQSQGKQKKQTIPSPSTTKPSSNSPSSVAPLTLTTQMKSNDDREYLTPELRAMSEKRSQQKGMVATPSGTVRELNLLMKNKDGKTIDEIIYKDDQTRKKRKQFQEQRIKFLKEKSQFQELGLVKYNMKYDQSYSDEEKRVDTNEFEKIRGKNSLDEFKQEIPMCVVVPGYNNNAKFRLEYNLNSIFLQNYTNYFIVIINDASTDGSDELFRKYLHFYNISTSKYVYIENSQRHTALENIYMATHYYCSEDSVVVNLDGDDEFIGKNVLKVFNAGYQKHKAGVVYSNFYWYEQGGNLMLGFTSEYPQSERDGNSYRHAPQRFSHLRSYRTELFRKIAAKDFQDDQGKFYTIAYDMAIYFPVMELSCGRIKKIDGYHYLYNINTGLNDYQVDRNKQVAVDNRVRSSPKYTCDEEFNKRMRS